MLSDQILGPVEVGFEYGFVLDANDVVGVFSAKSIRGNTGISKRFAVISAATTPGSFGWAEGSGCAHSATLPRKENNLAPS